MCSYVNEQLGEPAMVVYILILLSAALPFLLHPAPPYRSGWCTGSYRRRSWRGGARGRKCIVLVANGS